MLNKRACQALAGAAALMLLGSAANAQSIAGSKHDLGANITGTNEICVFCHTPHGSNTSAEAPLWNKNLPSTSYTRYAVSTTLDGANENVGSVSLACLSCHDGTLAIDAVLNEPGSGMGDGVIGTGEAMDAYLTRVNGAGTYTPVPVLEADLSNDHPVSIQYGGGGITVTNSTDGSDNTNHADGDFVSPRYGVINGRNAWWVNYSGAGTDAREKTDMILYTRTGSVSGVDEPFVECASCHDPHNADSNLTGEVSFLRVSNDVQSGLCRTCHTK